VCACGFEGPAQALADDLEHLMKNDPRMNRQTILCRSTAIV
jgi:hypothetical protein